MRWLSPLLLLSLYAHNTWAEGEMKFSGTLISQPSCILKGESDLYADFGNMVLSNKVDGVNYMVTIDYGMTCTGNPNNTLKIQLFGLATDFDAKALKTTNPNLGIAIYNGNTRIGVNDWINFTYPTLPVLKMVPIKRPDTKLEASSIGGNVVFYLDYQ